MVRYKALNTAAICIASDCDDAIRYFNGLLTRTITKCTFPDGRDTVWDFDGL